MHMFLTLQYFALMCLVTDSNRVETENKSLVVAAKRSVFVKDSNQFKPPMPAAYLYQAPQLNHQKRVAV